MKVDNSNVYHIPNIHTKCPVCGKRRERYMLYNPFSQDHYLKDYCIKCKTLEDVIDKG